MTHVVSVPTTTLLGMADRSPAPNKSAFDCPLCGVYAKQTWCEGRGAMVSGAVRILDGFTFAFCSHCDGASAWHGDELIYPKGFRLGSPAPDETPPNVRALYDEAREVATTSPRSAAALLRLALQHLVDDLVPGPGNIDSKIGWLVASDLDPRVQQAMDTLRVVGNNAVHPGQIEIDDDPSLVPSLFDLLVLVVDHLIVRPAEVERLYDSLPPGAIEAIARRDTPAE